MATFQQNKTQYAPDIGIATFFSSIDDNSLVELVVWNGRLGFKFKRLGRTADGAYDKETTKIVSIYPKAASIVGISELMNTTIKERREAFSKGEEYQDFDKYFETSNERYDSRTGEKMISSNFKITTMKDASGVLRVVLVGQNSTDTVEVMLSEKDSTADFQVPGNLVIDKKDIQLYKFGAVMSQLCNNNSVMAWYNMGKAFADYTIKGILFALGKGDNSGGSSISGGYSNPSSGGGYIEDEDAPF